MSHIKVDISQEEGVLPCRISKPSSVNVIGLFIVQLFLEKTLKYCRVLILLYYCVGAKCMSSDNS
jgi:hypothetical protein